MLLFSELRLSSSWCERGFKRGIGLRVLVGERETKSERERERERERESARECVYWRGI